MNRIKEINYLEFKNLRDKAEFMATLVYTPTCGTCHLAKRMLSIVVETVAKGSYNQVNLNFNEGLAMDYEILSVPCLLIHQNGRLVDKIYNFTSVPFLYNEVISYF